MVEMTKIDAKSGELSESVRAILSPISPHFWPKTCFTLILGVLHFKQFYGFFVLFCANVSEAESTFVLIHIRFLHVRTRGFLIAIEIVPQDFLTLTVAILLVRS